MTISSCSAISTTARNGSLIGPPEQSPTNSVLENDVHPAKHMRTKLCTGETPRP